MTEQQGYLDSTRSVEERAAHLLSLMTVEEKAAQITSIWASDLCDANRQFAQARAAEAMPHGIGHVSRIAAITHLPPAESAAVANEIQRFIREQTRLGIPAIVHEESCAGYMAYGTTTFPQAIGQAAAWNPTLIEQSGAIIRREMRSAGSHHALAPVLDVARDPRWGRVEETFGEDPYLIAAVGSAYIRGLQGDDWKSGIVATAKAFIGYGLSEGGMNWAPAHLPERLLREVYAFPFAAAITEAGIASVMNAYQELDGIPVGSDRRIMVELLRDTLGFTGVVVSDYFTLKTFVHNHRIAANPVEAARFGLEAGIDVELPTAYAYGQALLDALDDGSIRIDLVDASVRRVLEMKFRLGLFEQPYVDTGRAAEVCRQPESIALSRRLAVESLVLLKNDGTLPLQTSIGTVAVIGPSADDARLMQGDYHYPAHMQHHTITASSDSEDAPTPEAAPSGIDWDAQRAPTVTVLNGLRTMAADRIRIDYAPGCAVDDEDTSGFQEAVALASAADVAVVVVGDRSGLGRDCTSGEAVDRATLELPGVQQALVQAVAATGTPTIVVLTCGRPPVLTGIIEQVNAVLVAWLPGEQGGAAVADALFGRVNPGGRLPISLPRHVGQVPVYYNHKPMGQHSHWHGHYADMPTTPLFPFGYGLSYTQFTYSDLTLDREMLTATDTVAVSVTVQNTGEVAGDEVIQLYIADPIASVTRPVRALKGFHRLHLPAGESRRITFHLAIAHFAFFDREMRFVVEPGAVEIMVGASSDDIRLVAQASITGEPTPVEPVFSTPVMVERVD